MAERHWLQQTRIRDVYLDDTTGRIIGLLRTSFSDGTFTAYAYDRVIGAYVVQEDAQRAVEAACVEIERLEAQAKVLAETKRATAQADGFAALVEMDANSWPHRPSTSRFHRACSASPPTAAFAAKPRSVR